MENSRWIDLVTDNDGNVTVCLRFRGTAGAHTARQLARELEELAKNMNEHAALAIGWPIGNPEAD
jgi:hypothetical protein